MRQPSQNRITLPYGSTSPPYSSSSPHQGSDYSYYSDLAKTKPNPVWVAPEKVVITFKDLDPSGSCGLQLDFQSVDGKRKYRACHNKETYVKQGQTVEEGTKLGYMGATGQASGTHLHLVMWVNGVRVDPYATINKLTGEEIVKPTKDEINNAFNLLGIPDNVAHTDKNYAYYLARDRGVLWSNVAKRLYAINTDLKKQIGTGATVLAPGDYKVK